MQANQLISVVVPSYNHEHYIRHCLNSIQTNVGHRLQVVVVDDCSTDRTAAIAETIIAEWGSPHIFVRHEVNKGVCRTLNDGLRLCQGDYVAFLASDDAWPSDRLSRLLAGFTDEIDGRFGDIQTMDVHENLGRLIRQPPPDGRTRLQFDDVLFWRSHINLQSALFRRSAVEQIGGFDPTYTFEDIDFFLKITRKHRIEYIPATTVFYRIIPGSLSRRPQAHGDGMIDLIEHHLLDCNLTVREKNKARGLAWLKLAESHYNNLSLAGARRAALRAALRDPALIPRSLRLLGGAALGPRLIENLRRIRTYFSDQSKSAHDSRE